MISTSDFKKGGKILYKGEPYIILDYSSTQPGKGGAYIRTKMKSMVTGLIAEDTFRSGEKFQTPDLEYKKMQYLYRENDLFNFMDQESFDQVSLNKNQLTEVENLLKEQEVYTILYFEGRPIAVNPPMFMEIKIAETPPGVRGDTAKGGATKPATLESGLVLQVPLFVEEGDFIKIDTRDNSYIERVKK